MTGRRTNRALSSIRRWTAGGLGLHLADAYASTGNTSSTTSSSSNQSSSFASTGSVTSSSNIVSTTTKGS